jgi:Ran-binding protein 3
LLDKHAATLFKDATVSPAPARGSASFKLEPPKLCSPLSCKFVDNNKPPSLRVSGGDGTCNSTSALTGADACTDATGAPSAVDGATPVPGVDTAALSTAGHVLKITPLPADTGFIFGQQMDSRVATTLSETSTTVTPVPDVKAATSSFVFGSNIAERVVMATGGERVEPAAGVGDENAVQPSDASKGAAPDLMGKPAEAGTEAAPSCAQSLEQSAALQLAKQSHVELKEVEVVTGEEDESNVFQFSVKLFMFEKKTQSWLERGLGLLRLNDRLTPSDSSTFQSRLVMRVQGSLRVVLNTMIWPGMLIERSSKKSIKISAVDPEDGIKIYLIQANPSDADHIFSAISARAHQLKATDHAKHSPPSSVKDSPPVVMTTAATATCSEKRSSDAIVEGNSFPEKRQRVDRDQRREQVEDESNDSSAVDPETEASNEGFSSSPPIQSSSSEA